MNTKIFLIISALFTLVIAQSEPGAPGLPGEPENPEDIAETGEQGMPGLPGSPDFVPPELQACVGKFEKDEKRAEISEKCYETTGFDPSTLPEDEEEFMKTFEDKCFAKCVLEGLGHMKDGDFVKEELDKYVETFVLDEKIREEVMKNSEDCLKEIEAEMEEKEDKEENACVYATKYLFCTAKKDSEIKC